MHHKKSSLDILPGGAVVAAESACLRLAIPTGFCPKVQPRNMGLGFEAKSLFGILVLTMAVWLMATAAHAASPRVILTPATGFTITWDGNNGGFSNPSSGAGPSNNVALA